MSRSETLRLKQIKANLERRAIILDGIRAFFKKEGFLELETPVLVLRLPQSSSLRPSRSTAGSCPLLPRCT